MMHNMEYIDISKFGLRQVLAEMKELVASLDVLDFELKFKLEFVLEELLSNSFQYLLPASNSIIINYSLDVLTRAIIYQEVGVMDLDVSGLINAGKFRSEHLDELIPGGLGLNLIMQLVHNFSYTYTSAEQTRTFNIRI